MRGTRLLALVLALGGCGLGITDSPSGGADNLPTSGAGPYGKPELDFDTPADEPFVVEDDSGNLYDPAVLRRDDGGFLLWMGRQLDNVFDQSEIWRAEIPSVEDLPDVPPTPAMLPDQSWEVGRVAAPAVIEDGGRLVMYYEGGAPDAPSIGRAESADGGVTWQRAAGNPVLADAAEPTVAHVDGQWYLYVTRPGQVGIFRATSADGLAFALDPGPVIQPRPDLPGAFDPVAVSDPFVIAGRTEAGQLHWAMFFNGIDATGDAAIGYAGSFDGVVWERFGGPDPVLTDGSPSENGPTAVLEPTRGFLFYQQIGQQRQRIAVALHP